MNKKITSFVLATLMLAGSTSFNTYAAMSNGSVVIGAKAFDLVYANDEVNQTEISNEVIAGGDVYVKDFNGDWIDNTTGIIVAASVIPAVVYKNYTGVTNFGVADTNATPPIEVTPPGGGVVTPPKDVTPPVINSVTLDINGSVSATKDVNGNFKVSLAGKSNTDMFTAITLNANEKITGTINIYGQSKPFTTGNSSVGTVYVSDLLGDLDPQGDGISVGTLKNILSLAGGTITAIIRDTAGNEKSITITITVK